MGDKVKNLPRHALLPPYLIREERFAFRSPLPLDVCVRRLLAKNDGSLIQDMLNSARTQTQVDNIGMNDQQFVVVLRENSIPVWSIGTLMDIDGEATWVAGKIGIGDGAWIGAWFGVVPIIAIALFSLIAGPQLYCMVVFTAAAAGLLVQNIRTATHPTRRFMREVFGGKGPGPLPFETTMEGNDERDDEETADGSAGESAQNAGGGGSVRVPESLSAG